jgi:gas vesicle protein
MKIRASRTLRVFLCGAVLGACLGLFLAPRPGDETQTIVKREVSRSAAEAEALGRRIGAGARRAVERMSAAVSRIGRG